jgi:chemotaxis protein CheX
VKSILLVDDKQEVLDQLTEAFSQGGKYKVLTALDGLDACQKTRNQPFDAIYTDFSVPRLNGAKLIRALREAKCNAGAALVILTTSAELAQKECKESGIYHNLAFLEAPADVAKLVQLIELMLESTPRPGSEQSGPTVKVDVDFINPFIAAVMDILRTMGRVKSIEFKKPSLLKAGEAMTADITGNIVIIATQFRGTLAVSFPEKTYLTVASNMLGGTYTEITPEIQDVIAELTNLIYGQSKRVLNDKGFNLKPAIPSVVRGKNHSIISDGTHPVLLIPFTTDIGDFFVTISVTVNR